MDKGTLDCVIIGGGPAGLTAAIYLARFCLTVIVIDEGNSRAALIPRTRNHAGFPGGIAGSELVKRMREQALEFGADLRQGRVTSLHPSAGGFSVSVSGEVLHARTVLLATGVTNFRPAMPDDVHAKAVSLGRLRYCPVCDGFEVMDQSVAVIGTGSHAAKEAIFLRAYTRSVSLAPSPGGHDLSADDRQRLATANIQVIEDFAHGFELDDQSFSFMSGGKRLSFDTAYAALGSLSHSSLAAAVGAVGTDGDCIVVDAHQRTTVPSLYAAGDVVFGLDQISHAMGQAGVAATAIRNDLAEKSPIFR